MASLQHILVAEPDEPDRPSTSSKPPEQSTATTASPAAHPPREPAVADAPKDDSAAANHPAADPDEPMYTSTTASTRRNPSGSVSSVYSGNKIRHLKKEDGIPLWRRDIQYDFLRLVFYDRTRCFTKYSEDAPGFTFAEVYIDAMAKSSKCSRILKEKLLQDIDGAISMAMVCLLVNVGRMNTTLNFFPEMRAQLRTYHSIPALQARQDPNAYKQLQDAPRLKSILKGATEDEPQPSTVDEIRAAPRPRTNAVNLIFVMSQSSPKISELHFVPPRDFYDLVMRPTLTSESRARAFLWLVWWYLESDFSADDALRNPFGPGQHADGEEDTAATPLKVPTLDTLTEEQAALENVDSDDEKLFGEVKRKERIAILASEPSPAMTALKRARKEKSLTASAPGYRSDDELSETGWSKAGDGSKPQASSAAARGHPPALEDESSHTRSPTPTGRAGFQPVNSQPKPPQQDMRIDTLLNGEGASVEAPPAPAAPPPAKKGPGRGNWRRKPKIDPSASSPAHAAAPDPSHPVALLPNTAATAVEGAAAPATPGSGAYSAYSSFPVQGTTSPQRTTGASAFPPSNSRDHVPTPSYQAQKRHRGVTQHQSALISHRRAQIDYTIDRRIRGIHLSARRAREEEGAIFRVWKRIRLLPPDYDSEEEQIRARKARDRGDKDDDYYRGASARKDAAAATADDPADPASRRPKLPLAAFSGSAAGDVGEELKNLARSIGRAGRRLERWQEQNLPGTAMIRRKKREALGAAGPTTKRRRGTDPSDPDDDDDDDDSRHAGRRKRRNTEGTGNRVDEREEGHFADTARQKPGRSRVYDSGEEEVI